MMLAEVMMMIRRMLILVLKMLCCKNVLVFHRNFSVTCPHPEMTRYWGHRYSLNRATMVKRVG